MSPEEFEQLRLDLIYRRGTSYNKLIKNYRDSCLSALVNKGCALELAEDLFQDAFMKFTDKVIDNTFTYRHEGGVKGYLVKRMELDFYSNMKKQKRRSDIRKDIDIPLAYITDKETEKLHQALWKAIDQMQGKNCSKIFRMVICGKMKLAEIAKLLGYSSGDAVTERKRACKKELTLKALDIYESLM